MAQDDPFAQFAVQDDPFAAYAAKEAAPERSATERFVAGAANVLNPIAMVKGVYGMARHPVDTYNGLVDASAQQFSKAAENFNQGRYSEAIGHGAAGLLPGIGPMAANAGEQIASGDIAGGLGAGLAMTAGPAALTGGARLVTNAMGRGALRTMQSALKPTATLEKARAGAGFGSKSAITQAVLDEGRIVSPGSLNKAQAALDATDAAAHAKLQAGAGQGVTVDPFKVTRAIDEQATGTFGKQINAQPDTSAIAQVHQNFATNPHISDPVGGMAPIDAVTAHEFASNTGRNLKGKFGRLGGATVEAEKAGREAITSQLRDQIPELKNLWDAEARQITVRDALNDAVARRANTDPMGLGGIVGAVKSPGLALTALADRSALFKSLAAQGMNKGRALVPSGEAIKAALLSRLLDSDQETQGR